MVDQALEVLLVRRPGAPGDAAAERNRDQVSNLAAGVACPPVI